MANGETILSDCSSEELKNVVDCNDIDDESSVYYYPHHFYPIPEKLEEDNVWYNGD